MADAAAAVAFRARVNGTSPRNVLASGGEGPDREQHDRRRAAARILREHGLADVLGVPSGTVLDVNMGTLEAPVDERARAEMDRQYEFERSAREAEARTRAITAMAARLDERRRAAGLDGSRESRRAALTCRSDPGYDCPVHGVLHGHVSYR
jgi:hypothetical protein